MHQITYEEMMVALRRDIDQKRRAFGRQVEFGKLTEREARERIARFVAILDLLLQIEDDESLSCLRDEREVEADEIGL